MIFLRITTGILFFYCATVQVNDVDAWVWIVLYSIPIFWCIFPPDTELARSAVGFNALIYLIAGMWMFPSEFHGISEMKDHVKEIEEAREALGLIVASLGIFLSIFFKKEER